jgi:glycosyltransferase involved in cell wall biosynthesis
MKILVVDHNALDPLRRSLYARLSALMGSAVRIVVPHRWHDNYRFLYGERAQVGAHCDVLPLQVLFPSRTHRLVYRGLAGAVRSFAPDILYVNAEPENFASWFSARLCPGVGRPMLVFSTWRNIDHRLCGYPYRFEYLHRIIERTVLARAAGAIAFTPAAASIFRKNGFEEIATIPPEVDTGIFLPHRRMQPRPWTVGYAGRFHAGKGIDILIRSLAQLPPDVRLLLIGSGPQEAGLRGLSDTLGVSSRIDWQTHVPHEEMPQQLARMDTLVLPSRTGVFWKEQFGRVLVEAMASGVPVVGSDSGEIPHVIGDAGIVVPEGDPRALADALLRLRGDEGLRRGFIAKGLARAERLFSINAVLPLYQDFFSRLSAGRASGEEL